jgi:hypothetical protein
MRTSTSAPDTGALQLHECDLSHPQVDTHRMQSATSPGCGRSATGSSRLLTAAALNSTRPLVQNHVRPPIQRRGGQGNAKAAPQSRLDRRFPASPASLHCASDSDAKRDCGVGCEPLLDCGDAAAFPVGEREGIDCAFELRLSLRRFSTAPDVESPPQTGRPSAVAELPTARAHPQEHSEATQPSALRLCSRAQSNGSGRRSAQAFAAQAESPPSSIASLALSQRTAVGSTAKARISRTAKQRTEGCHQDLQQTCKTRVMSGMGKSPASWKE